MTAASDNNLIRHYQKRYRISEILSDDLMSQLSVFHFNPREYIIRTHDPLKRLYFFVEGKAKVFMTMENGKSLMMRFYEPFEIIGDVEFACYDHHICNLQAISPVTCLGIDISAVKRSIEANTNLLLYICKSLGQKLATFNMSSAINQMYPLENRLASYLIAISNHSEDHSGIIKEIYADNLTELAALLGTSYRQLTRVIRKFRDAGILGRDDKEMVILDFEQMKQLSSDVYG